MNDKLISNEMFLTSEYFLYTIFGKITKYSHFYGEMNEIFLSEELFGMSS